MGGTVGAAATTMAERTVGEPMRLRVHGRAEIRFDCRDGRTRLDTLYHHDPLRVLFPAPPAGEAATAVLVTTSGGLVGGDRLDVAIEAADGARALVTAQAAEKVYRSAGRDSRIAMSLRAGAGAWLEWLPQETIVFENGRLCRQTTIEADAGARVLAGEILVLGRTAMGERVSGGRVRDSWRVRRGGRLVWADALRLDGELDAVTASRACLDGAVACATVVYVAEDAAALRDSGRARLDAAEGVRAACTLVGGVLVARWLGRDALAVRESFADFWAAARRERGGLPASLPRLWSI